MSASEGLLIAVIMIFAPTSDDKDKVKPQQTTEQSKEK